jgi:hypothetical protein
VYEDLSRKNECFRKQEIKKGEKKDLAVVAGEEFMDSQLLEMIFIHKGREKKKIIDTEDNFTVEDEWDRLTDHKEKSYY